MGACLEEDSSTAGEGRITVQPGVTYRARGMRPAALHDAVAAVTLGMYVGLPYILLVVLVASFFSKAALLLLLLLACATALLPPAPLRWQGMLCGYIMATWQHYFSMR